MKKSYFGVNLLLSERRVCIIQVYSKFSLYCCWWLEYANQEQHPQASLNKIAPFERSQIELKTN